MFKKLQEENLELNRVNGDLNAELEINKADEINLLNNITRELLNLQDVNNLGIDEKEKNKHRNIIINKLVETCLDKINELSNTDQAIRQLKSNNINI